MERMKMADTAWHGMKKMSSYAVIVVVRRLM